MTEEEWQTGADPDELYIRLPANLSRRKFLLVACACWRHVWLQATEEVRREVTATELAVDSAAGNEHATDDRVASDPDERFQEEWNQLWYARRAAMEAAAEDVAAEWPGEGLNEQSADEMLAALGHRERLALEAERLVQIRILHDIFGDHPFGPLSIDPRWLTQNVVAIAKTTYSENSFDRLPILADALEDAGCTDRAILDHCRQPGEHVRGCWVVDLVLGKQ